MKKDIFKVQDVKTNEILIWDINDILNEVNHNVIADGFSPYLESDWFDGWVEGDSYNLLSINDKVIFHTNACKDLVEHMLIREVFSRIGIDIPTNIENIVQFCYEDIMDCADEQNWHSGDVVIAFRRWIESK